MTTTIDNLPSIDIVGRNRYVVFDRWENGRRINPSGTYNRDAALKDLYGRICDRMEQCEPMSEEWMALDEVAAGIAFGEWVSL